MSEPPTLGEQVAALERGVGVLDMAGWHAVRVSGADAWRWLNDLVTADVAALPEGGTTRSLLLGPTGRIRADLLVHRRAEELLLLQSPGQPAGADALLEPYVLSSDVSLGPVEGKPVVIPRPGLDWVVAEAAPGGTVRIGEAAFESWRIALGVARFPTDLDTDSLPAEAGLDDPPIVDRDKGCYLGQESVAKVRNAGHPTRLVFPVRASGPVRAGEAIVAEEAEVGSLTSADGRAAIARVRWDARDARLATVGGTSLTRR